MCIRDSPRTDLPDVPRPRPTKVPNLAPVDAPLGRRAVAAARRPNADPGSRPLLEAMEVDDRPEVQVLVVDATEDPVVGPGLAVTVHDHCLAAVAEGVRPI